MHSRRRSEDRFRRLLVKRVPPGRPWSCARPDRDDRIRRRKPIEELTGYSVDELVWPAATRVVSSSSPRTSSEIRGISPRARDRAKPQLAVREDIRVHHRDGSVAFGVRDLVGRNQLDDPGHRRASSSHVHDINRTPGRRRAAERGAAGPRPGLLGFSHTSCSTAGRRNHRARTPRPRPART